MAKKIIIINDAIQVSEGMYEEDPYINYVFWIPLPQTKQKDAIDLDATSVYSGISEKELNDIKGGKVKEISGKLLITADMSIDRIKQMLIAEYNKTKVALHAELLWKEKPSEFKGTYWDGDAWTVLQKEEA